MSLFVVVRIFTLTIFFNLFLPSGDVYSDVILMYQTWTFQNTESIEMSGCKACYGKDEPDLFPAQKTCTTCITKNLAILCGKYTSVLNKLFNMEHDKQCENKKWSIYKNGTLVEGDCYRHHYCCFETKNNSTKMKSKDENKLYSDSESNHAISYGDYYNDDKTGLGCGIDACNIHLDYVKHYKGVSRIHDFKSWKSKVGYSSNTGLRYGGKNCRLLRIYSWSMAIPISINLIFSSMIFYNDVKSKKSTKYETLFLILLMYPQWRTLKVLVRYFFHKDEEQLTNQLDANDKEVSFVEPFCESGLQVSKDIS